MSATLGPLAAPDSSVSSGQSLIRGNDQVGNKYIVKQQSKLFRGFSSIFGLYI